MKLKLPKNELDPHTTKNSEFFATNKMYTFLRNKTDKQRHAIKLIRENYKIPGTQ